MKKYKTIYADPPWQERGAGKIKRGADRHYKTLATSVICGMFVRLGRIIEYDCHCYIWVTNNFLPDGLAVMHRWGFRYITKIDWGKVKNPEQFGLFDFDFEPEEAQRGLGQYFRGSTESCLFGVRGRLPYKGQGNTLILSERTKHSRKPKAMREMIERVSYPPYLELFAREKTENWDVWGNEIESDIEL